MLTIAAGDYAFASDVAVLGIAIAAMLAAAAVHTARGWCDHQCWATRKSLPCCACNRSKVVLSALPLASVTQAAASGAGVTITAQAAASGAVSPRTKATASATTLAAIQFLGRVAMTLALVLYPAATRSALSLLNCASVSGPSCRVRHAFCILARHSLRT